MSRKLFQHYFTWGVSNSQILTFDKNPARPHTKVAVDRITYIQTPVPVFMTGLTNYYLKAPVVCISTPS